MEKRKKITLIGAVVIGIVNLLIFFLAGGFLFNERKEVDVSTLYTTFALGLLAGLICCKLFFIAWHYKLKTYDKLFDSYKVVGVLNEQKEYPYSVQVVLEKKGIYYIQEQYDYNNGKLISVLPLEKDKEKDIIPIENFWFSNFDFPQIIIGDKALLGFQYDYNKAFIGTSKEMRNFLYEYNNAYR